MPALRVEGLNIEKLARRKLNELADVSLPSPNLGDVVKWDGANWVNAAPGSLTIGINDLTDVIVSGASAGDVLRYDGSNWVNTKTLSHALTFSAGLTVSGGSISASGIATTVGALTVGDTLTMVGSTLRRSVTTGSLTITGDTSSSAGGLITLYGSAHATQANDIVFASGASAKLMWDDSAAAWSFQGTPVSMGALTATTATVQSSNVALVSAINTAASGGSAGGGFYAGSNDGAAMANNDRLGLYGFVGRDDAGLEYKTAIRAMTAGAWTASSHPYQMEFYVVPSGQQGEALALTLNSDRTAAFTRSGTFGSGLTTENQSNIVRSNAGTNAGANNTTCTFDIALGGNGIWRMGLFGGISTNRAWRLFDNVNSVSKMVVGLGSSGALSYHYNANNYLSVTVGSTGSTTFDLTGTSPTFTFGKAVTVMGPLTVSAASEDVFTAKRTTAGAVGYELGSLDATGGEVYLDLSVMSGADYHFRLIRNSGANGNLDLINTGTGSITLTSTGGVRVQNADLWVDTNGYALRWKDASGTSPHIIMQSDNNWVFYGTSATGASQAIFSVQQRTNDPTFKLVRDLEFSTLGRFDCLNNGGAPAADHILSFDGSAAKWRSRFIQVSFSTSALTTAALIDGSAIGYAFVTPTWSGVDPGAPNAPTTTAIYKGAIVKLSHASGNPPSGTAFSVEYAVFSGSWGSWTTLTDTTGDQIVHSGLDPAKQYKYRVRIRYNTSSYSAYSSESSAVTPSQKTEVNAYGLILASQISTAELSAIVANIGTITAGVMKNAANTVGLWLGPTIVHPSIPAWRRYLDLETGLLHIKDDQATPKTRVQVGKVGSGTTDYGLQVFDSAGATCMDFTGAKRILAVPVQDLGTKTGTFTVDLSSGLTQQVQLGASGLRLQFSNPTNGGRYRIWFQQDTVGGRTLPTFDDVVMWKDDAPPTLSPTPGVFDVIEFEYRSSPTPRYTAMVLQQNVYLPTPRVQDITSSSPGNGTTTHNVSMPASVSSGELLLAFFANDATTTVTTPSGWTLLTTDTQGVFRHSVFAKVSDGTEGGGTVNFATSANSSVYAQVYRITKWYGSLTNGVGATASPGTFTGSNPPAYCPSQGAPSTDRHLWLVGYAGTGWTSIAAPGNYANKVDSGGGVNMPMATARRSSYRSNEDPGGWALTGGPATFNWITMTVYIRPPA